MNARFNLPHILKLLQVIKPHFGGIFPARPTGFLRPGVEMAQIRIVPKLAAQMFAGPLDRRHKLA
jgi:hypothetical protein